MSGLYTRDKMKVTPVTKTPGTGELVKGKSFNVRVMTEDESNMLSGGTSNGRPVQSDLYIFTPPKTAIKKGDIIQITERFGEVVTEPERTVIQVSTYGSFNASHREVYA